MICFRVAFPLSTLDAGEYGHILPLSLQTSLAFYSFSIVALLFCYSLVRLCVRVLPVRSPFLLQARQMPVLANMVTPWLFKTPFQSFMESPHTHRTPATSLNTTKYAIYSFKFRTFCTMATSFTFASAYLLD